MYLKFLIFSLFLIIFTSISQAGILSCFRGKPTVKKFNIWKVGPYSLEGTPFKKEHKKIVDTQPKDQKEWLNVLKIASKREDIEATLYALLRAYEFEAQPQFKKLLKIYIERLEYLSLYEKSTNESSLKQVQISIMSIFGFDSFLNRDIFGISVQTNKQALKTFFSNYFFDFLWSFSPQFSRIFIDRVFKKNKVTIEEFVNEILKFSSKKSPIKDGLKFRISETLQLAIPQMSTHGFGKNFVRLNLIYIILGSLFLDDLIESLTETKDKIITNDKDNILVLINGLKYLIEQHLKEGVSIYFYGDEFKEISEVINSEANDNVKIEFLDQPKSLQKLSETDSHNFIIFIDLKGMHEFNKATQTVRKFQSFEYLMD